MTGEPIDYARGQQWHARQANARKQWQQMRDLAITVPCRDCRMPKDAACVSRPKRGRPHVLKHFPAHASRITDARKATAK